MNFNGIIGQHEVVESLKRSLSEDRIGHAYIFSGPAGIGKKTISRVFAAFLLCENPGQAAVCGECKACLLFRNGTNPDFYRINTEEAAVGVDLIRRIQDDSVLKPIYSRRKIYIIENAEKMTDQAQNCLLKTFEEPQRYVVVILLTTNYEALFETVRSRAVHYHFRKYSREQVSRAIRESTRKDGEAIKLYADYSDGNIGMALKLARSGDFSLLRDSITALLPGVEKGSVDDILEFAGLFEKNRDRIGLLLDIIQLYYRDVLVLSETGNANILINSDKKDMIMDSARRHRSRSIAEKIEAVEAFRRALKLNANYQLAMDNLLFRLREGCTNAKGGRSQV
ncbi:MAG: ATP-binding protein [Acetivibrionales bacterium]|jgi:DNA polymerase-3 subunit delta'